MDKWGSQTTLSGKIYFQLDSILGLWQFPNDALDSALTFTMKFFIVPILFASFSSIGGVPIGTAVRICVEFLHVRKLLKFEVLQVLTFFWTFVHFHFIRFILVTEVESVQIW